MTKKVKVLIGLFGIVGISALLAGAVVSCSSKSSNNSSDNSSSSSSSSSSTSSSDSDKSTYNTADGWDKLTTTITKNPSGTSWTTSTATQNFQTIFNNLSSSQQTQSIIDAITAGGVAYYNYLNSQNLLSSPFPKVSNNSVFNVSSQKYNYQITNISGSNNSYSFDIVRTDNITTSIPGQTASDIAISTVTFQFTGVSFKEGLQSNSFSSSNLKDNYAAFIISGYKSCNEIWNTYINVKTNKARSILIYLMEHGFQDDILKSYPYPSGLDYAIPGFIYVYNGGINYGKISN